MSRYTIASVSCGKDSIVIPYECIRRNLRLDEVIMYDTGMEFQAIYDEWAALVNLLDENGIKHTVLHPEYSFCWQMFERPVNVGKENEHLGYSWCGGTCRWGTADKRTILGKYAEDRDAIVLVGIAADEPERQEYEILDRVSCWCCTNKNMGELRNIYRYLPEYWDRLKELQRKTCRPMKGDGKSVFDLETRFKLEDARVAAGLSIRNKDFFRELSTVLGVAQL